MVCKCEVLYAIKTRSPHLLGRATGCSCVDLAGTLWAEWITLESSPITGWWLTYPSEKYARQWG